MTSAPRSFREKKGYYEKMKKDVSTIRDYNPGGGGGGRRSFFRGEGKRAPRRREYPFQSK